MSSHDESQGKLNLLVAYPYLNKQKLAVMTPMFGSTRFLLDSGAFTAWKAGKSIALDDYCRLLETLPMQPWRYFTLDVIGDPGASMKNYEAMLKRGFKPVPIFTRGEDPSVLDDYYKTSDVVGVGGLVGTHGNKGFVNGIMRHIKGRRVHWLGFTDINYLKHYRPYMCDSSSWDGGARFGSLRLYVGAGRFITAKKADFIGQPSPELVEHFRRIGVDHHALNKKQKWHGANSLSRVVCAASAIAMSLDAHRNIGTHVFLAATADDAVRVLIERFVQYTERKAA